MENRLVRRAALPQVAGAARRLHARHGGPLRDRAARPSGAIPSSTISTASSRPSRICVSTAPTATREDLAAIYGEVHFTWAIDFFEEGLNSSWLLPNRLYEGCRFGAVPIAMQAAPRPARFLAERHLGLLLDDAVGRMAWPRLLGGISTWKTTPPCADGSWRRIAAHGSAIPATAAHWSSACGGLAGAARQDALLEAAA